MIKKIFLIFFFLNTFNISFASIKSEIITNFKKIDNLSFDFKQVIKEKTKKSKCIIRNVTHRGRNFGSKYNFSSFYRKRHSHEVAI